MATPTQLRRRRRRREFAGIGYRVVLSIAAIAVAVLQVLVGWGPLKPHPPTGIMLGLVGFVGVAAARDSIFSAVTRLKAPKREGLRTRLNRFAAVALTTVSELCHVPPADLGVCIFLIEKDGLEWTSRRLVRAERLERVVRLRLAETPQESDIYWTIGKGLIGLCWQERRPEHRHLQALADRLAPLDRDNPLWETHAQEMGFTVDEYREVFDKYAEILAVPIRSNGKLVGVVSIDLSMASNLAGHGSVLDAPETREAAALVASLTAMVAFGN